MEVAGKLAQLERLARKVRLGRCPRCFGHGPLDAVFRDDEGRLVSDLPPCPVCGHPPQLIDIDFWAGIALAIMSGKPVAPMRPWTSERSTP